MDQQTVRKTFKYKLQPVPEQELELARTLLLCRTLYNVALEQRITAWQRCHVSVSRYQQEAELKAIRAAFPEYAAIHSHVLQDVLARLDRTYQAFFRRVQRGEKAGFPRFKGRDRFHSFTYKEVGNGARLDNGFLVHKGLSVRWHSCPDCGTSLHRDHNAALNILRLGREHSGAGQAPPALTQPVGAYVA
jgi:transposase